MDASVEGGSPRRRSSSASSSPEFEFLGVGDPPPELLTADELFADGVLLPLHLLSLRHPHPEPEAPPGTGPDPEPEPEPDPSPPHPPQRPTPPAADIAASISCSPASGSKRWKDIFRVGEKKAPEEKERRKERKGGGGGAAELNINIWPFSRSRSAGNAAAGGARPRPSVSGRKASSAPCSRSNSRGESSKQPAGGRRWAASPGRSGGVPVGRTSPVWQIRRPEHRDRDKVTASKRANGVRVLNMNVNACIGYRGGQGSCRGDDKDGVTGRERIAGEGGGSLFSLRALFSKKVY